MRNWKPITGEQKTGAILLLGIPDKKLGPWLGYFSPTSNHWVSAGTGYLAHGHVPTHYDDLEGLTFDE